MKKELGRCKVALANCIVAVLLREGAACAMLTTLFILRLPPLGEAFLPDPFALGAFGVFSALGASDLGVRALRAGFFSFGVASLAAAPRLRRFGVGSASINSI